MKTKDYIFRCIALTIVWSGLVFPVVTANLFVPTGLFDWTLAVLVLITGGFLTITIWCGLEIVRWLSKGLSHDEDREQ